MLSYLLPAGDRHVPWDKYPESFTDKILRCLSKVDAKALFVIDIPPFSLTQNKTSA